MKKQLPVEEIKRLYIKGETIKGIASQFKVSHSTIERRLSAAGVSARHPNAVEHRPDGTTVIVLQQRDGTKVSCFIDTTDFDRVKDYQWYPFYSGAKGYAATNIRNSTKRTILCMHTLLCPDDRDFPPDHKDGNGFNNRRSNLRPATAAQNAQNRRKAEGFFSSKWKGVSYHHLRKKFRAYIKVNGKQISLGLFSVEEDAARAYDSAALKYFGNFAKLNFPEAV